MASQDDYVFPRDFLDNNRINLMHHLWTKSYGYLIHPKIQLTNQTSTSQMSGQAHGRRIWLLDVADQIAKSTAQLYGMDISFDTAPPPQSFPPHPVPADLVGSFDIVHVRFFSFVVLNDEIDGVVQRLFELLKPGGYLQWQEPDSNMTRVETVMPGIETENVTRLWKILNIQDPPLKPTWPAKLQDIFGACGFAGVETDLKTSLPPYQAFLQHECNLIIYLSEVIARKIKNENLAQQLKELLPLAMRDTKAGAYFTSNRWVVIGSKPE
ncbi:hypothetical protein GQ53DRAFT_870785 [Thozetella sp. PMI_491]|nr:hypothetical protein GQ53DRAFT_870785 [Thozetella sp. PMI_491]